jgi:hypothetical protein
MDHVTAVLVVPETLAVNCAAGDVAFMLLLAGEMDTVRLGGAACNASATQMIDAAVSI